MAWSTVDGTCVPLLSCCAPWGDVTWGYFGDEPLASNMDIIKQPLTLPAEEALHFLEGLAGVATASELARNQDRPHTKCR